MRPKWLIETEAWKLAIDVNMHDDQEFSCTHFCGSAKPIDNVGLILYCSFAAFYLFTFKHLMAFTHVRYHF